MLLDLTMAAALRITKKEKSKQGEKHGPEMVPPSRAEETYYCLETHLP